MTNKGSHWATQICLTKERRANFGQVHNFWGHFKVWALERIAFHQLLSSYPTHCSHTEEMFLETSLQIWWSKASLFHSILEHWELTDLCQRTLVTMILAPVYGPWGTSVHTCPFLPWLSSPLCFQALKQREEYGMGVGVAVVSSGSLGTHKPYSILQLFSDITLFHL